MSQSINQQVGFYGMGASGSLLAALAGRNANFHDITCIDINPKAIESYKNTKRIEVEFKKEEFKKNNFTAELPNGNFLTVSELEKQNEKPQLDVVYLTVPANQTETELQQLAKNLESVTRRNSVIVYLANGNEGLDHIPVDLSKYLTEDRTLIRGVLEHPVSKSADGKVTALSDLGHISKNGIAIGFDNRLSEGQLRMLGDTTNQMKIGFKNDKPINEVLFDKFLQILSMGYQAVSKDSFAEVANEGSNVNLVTKAMFDEAWKVGVKLKICPNNEEAKKQKWDVTCNTYKGKGLATGSLAQAVDKGVKTEANAIYGKFIDLAKQVGVETPIMERVYSFAIMAEQRGIKQQKNIQNGAKERPLDRLRTMVKNISEEKGPFASYPKSIVATVGEIKIAIEQQRQI